MRKWFIRVLTLLFVIPMAGFVLWYGFSFYPHINKIKTMATSANVSAQPVADALYIYAIAAESKYGIRAYASRQAYWSLEFTKNRTSKLSRHSNVILWHLTSYLHFDDKEIFGLWLSCSIEQCGNGLPSAAIKYYGKELSNMNNRELVGLVAMVKSPSAYKPGSERSEERIERILKKLQTHKKCITRHRVSLI